MSNTFGTCKQDTVTWFKTFDERGCAIVTFYPPGQTALDCPEVDKSCTLLLDPVKGAVILEQDGSETEIPLVDGILQLPYDMFGTVELSGTPGEPDYTATVTLPGQEPFNVCLNPVKDVLDADGNSVVDADGVAQLPASSTTTPVDQDGDGVVDTHLIKTSDGGQTEVCLFPVKDVLDQDGESVVDDEGVAQLPDGSFTEPNADGSIHTITTDDGVPTAVCTNPIKDIVQNADGSWTAIDQNGDPVTTWQDTTIPADGSSVFSVVDADGNTTLPDGTVVPAVDGEGNPLNPGDPILNILDGDGNYLGSKLCTVDTTVLVQDADGVQYPVDPETGNQIVDPVGPDVPVDPAFPGDWPTAPDAPHDVQILCDQDTGAPCAIVTASGVKALTKPVVLSGVEGGPLAPQPDGTFCVTPGIVDCDNVAIQKDDQLVRKIVDSDGTPWPTDGMGNQIPPCVIKDIALTKSALPGPYVEGDVVNFTFSVTNTGTVDLTNVQITDNLGTPVGGPIALAAGATDSTTFTMPYTYTADDVAAGGATNIAVVTGVAPDGQVVTDMNDASIFSLPPEEQPEIMLTKTITSGEGPYFEGNTIDYSFVVSNTGDVDLSGVVVNDPLLTVVGGPISLAVAAMDSTTFTGSYVVTAADADAGTVDNTATTEGTSPAGTVVTDDASASAPTDVSSLVKRCGTLPEIQLERVIVDPGNLQTNSAGDEYYTNSRYEFVSPGGTVLGLGESMAIGTDYADLFPEGNNPVTGNLAIVSGVHPAPWIGDAVLWTVPPGPTTPATPVTWQMSNTSSPGPSDGSVQGCESSFRTEIAYHDVDQGSTILGLSRPWDDEINDWQTSSGPYTDNGDGSFTFPSGSGGNWYVYWNMDGRTDSLTSTYIQNTADGTVQTHRMFWVPAVCVMEDADGNIVSAETVDGPLDPERYSDIVFA